MRKLKRKAGFTIIEVVTVVAMMAILFTVVTVSLRGQSKIKELDYNVRAMKAAVSLARNYALSGYEATTPTIYGYGVYFPSTPGGGGDGVFNDDNDNQFYDPVGNIAENYSNLSTVKDAVFLAMKYALTGHEAQASAIYAWGGGPSIPIFTGNYFIYADTNNNKAYNVGDNIVQNYSLDSNATIIDFSAGSCINGDVFFSLNEGAVYSCGLTGFGSARVNLVHSKDNKVTSSVTIQETTGLIE